MNWNAKDNAYRLKHSIHQSQLIVLKQTGHQVPKTHPESIYNALPLISNSSALRGSLVARGYRYTLLSLHHGESEGVNRRLRPPR